MFWKQKKQNSDASTAIGTASKDGVVESATSVQVANADTSVPMQKLGSSLVDTDESRRDGYTVPRGYTVRGNPCCSGSITILGSVEGIVRAKNVHIASSGSLDGSSVAGVITVEGSAKSNLIATERLGLLPGAQVSGRLQTQVIEISPMAQILDAEMKIG